MNSVRIIGGAWRSRRLRFPGSPGLRPTPDRVRETLFNWLGRELAGVHCLDLFAGSGALGFEAASRGAASVTMVERDPRACAALRENAARLQAREVKIIPGDALEFAARTTDRFDVMFLDPPFAEGLSAKLWPVLLERLSAHGMVYLESATSCPAPEGLEVLRQGRAGAVHFCLFGRTQDAQSRLSRNV